MTRLGERQFLNYVAVTPALRARGLGSALLGAAIEVARRPGQRTLELDSSFSRALFWLGLSYEQLSRLPE